MIKKKENLYFRMMLETNAVEKISDVPKEQLIQ
jgi:hypothetical protein